MRRPTCSSCAQRGETCAYSRSRRKPGPPKSSGRSKAASSTLTRATQSPARHEGIRGVSAEDPATHSTAGPDLATGVPYVPQSSNPYSLIDCGISGEEEEYLLNSYFETLHRAMPLFPTLQLPKNFGSSPVKESLKFTIVILTAKLTQFRFSSGRVCIDDEIDRLLSPSNLLSETTRMPPNLERCQKACILAFYEYHQFPGHIACMKIDKLCRLAYWIGLDHLRDPESTGSEAVNFPQMGEIVTDIEEWRLVWWAIYRLDCYNSESSGMPFQINEAVISTALVSDQTFKAFPDTQQSSSPIRLPTDGLDLWRVISSIDTASPMASVYNLHTLSVTAIRTICREGRSLAVTRRPFDPEVLRRLERNLATMRLALPANFSNPKRNALSGETRELHQLRLATYLHFLMAQLLLGYVSCIFSEPGEPWRLAWERLLETCQDITRMAQGWDSSYCISSDPTISYIMFTAVIFLDLQKKSTTATPELRDDIERCQAVLKLQLEHFSQVWTLPRLILLSVQGLLASFRGPFQPIHIRAILVRCRAPVHPHWLQFLSWVENDLQV
ncbi:hypothetical protein B0I35DRAFT_194070 [Stachybotrys elegans]|uniref:Transcription factor domain-containing protein n=1 Tax=Stachybotrys elegans TaxID=80388 RepID=A0A8K0T0Q3_9HYPO|nr:hypothetical protein B0I35DRAFT_194070 [Stachybotrys elegans]